VGKRKIAQLRQKYVLIEVNGMMHGFAATPMKRARGLLLRGAAPPAFLGCLGNQIIERQIAPLQDVFVEKRSADMCTLPVPAEHFFSLSG
jgi:hypothetical protein